MSLRIDRASFLTLTFGMAGLACNTGPSPVAANVVDIPQQPPQLTDGGAPAPVTRSDDDGEKPTYVPVVPDGDDDDEMVSNITEDGTAAIASAGPNGCGWVDPKSVARPTPACKDDQGAAGSCGVMKTCTGFAFPKQKCEAYRKLLKPRVAQKALDCLGKLSSKQACDACNAYRCGDLALKSACPDPTVDAQCAQVIAKCKSVSMNDCRTYFTGLNATGRAQMATCLGGKSGCGFGIYSCSESLF
jgi:hypothetical protein